MPTQFTFSASTYLAGLRTYSAEFRVSSAKFGQRKKSFRLYGGPNWMRTPSTFLPPESADFPENPAHIGRICQVENLCDVSPVIRLSQSRCSADANHPKSSLAGPQ